MFQIHLCFSNHISVPRATLSKPCIYFYIHVTVTKWTIALVEMHMRVCENQGPAGMTLTGRESFVLSHRSAKSYTQQTRPNF